MPFQENGSVIPDQTPMVFARNLKSLLIFFLFSFNVCRYHFCLHSGNIPGKDAVFCVGRWKK